jgi:hypothetical protein
VGKGSYTIDGNGSKNLVQNHPCDKSKVVVFSAIEGDEVATYTRGSAQLADGIGRGPLSEFFRLVTNPDIGLTAQVTPRGPGAALYVESVSTSELVVRAEAGSSQDATFDYMVAGLRIGFEEVSIIRGKEREAYIPAMDDHLQRYEEDPGLRRYNAMERFKEMRQSIGERDILDLSASDALRVAIGRFDPAVHNRHEEHRTDDDFAGFESAPDAEQATSPPDESSRPVALEPLEAGAGVIRVLVTMR